MIISRSRNRPALRSRLLLLCVLALAACSTRPAARQPTLQGDTPERLAELSAEIEQIMHDQLELWYPLVVDSVHGGFLSTFTYDWQPEGPQDKMIVTQARHIWTASKAAAWYPDDPRYRAAAAHGFAFLRDHMWDEAHGGFFNLVDRTGRPRAERGGAIVKQAYGNAFAIYGLSAYFHATGDTAALDLARRTFQWLEDHSHDPEHGGYFHYITREGTPMPNGLDGTPPKDQNSSIHLLEALTELYGVWPDPLVRTRLSEMLHLIRDTMVTPKGYLQLFFDRSWNAVSFRDSSEAVRKANEFLDHVSFGHDIETAYLLLEAEHVLGNEDPAETRTVAKRLVDHSIRFGWDEADGGLYDRGYYFDLDGPPAIVHDAKVWWAQAEALNSLLLFADLYPQDTLRYFDHAEALWAYTRDNLIDFEHGGWYEGGLDEEPQMRTARKAHIWKGNYHTMRAMMNSVRRLGE